jgi:hypothetical protein
MNRIIEILKYLDEWFKTPVARYQILVIGLSVCLIYDALYQKQLMMDLKEELGFYLCQNQRLTIDDNGRIVEKNLNEIKNFSWPLISEEVKNVSQQDNRLYNTT